jgi:hypothetical protein
MTPDKTHTLADVIFPGQPRPETGGPFITPSGHYEVQFVTWDDGSPDEVVGRNHCACTFCRRLRTA